MDNKNKDISVLLVDDEFAIRNALSYQLQKSGFSVTEMSSGAEAVQVLQTRNFHIVITDLVMEGVDGYGVIKAVKEYAPLTSIIVITGHSHINETHEPDLGVESILNKPFDSDRLISAIECCLVKQAILTQQSHTSRGEKTKGHLFVEDEIRESENGVQLVEKMAIDEIFRKKIDYLHLNLINESQDVIYIVDSELILKAYNDAWINFASSNNGEDILVKFPLGSRILDACRGVETFFANSYSNALKKNQPFEHNFTYKTVRGNRLFRHYAYPLKGSIGLMISNHSVVQKKPAEDAQEFYKQLSDEKGIILQCCKCNKIKDPVKRSWLWVPSIIKNYHPRTSHGICPQCLDHYYPE